MSDQTKIEWATHTFNPWEGCTKVSPGCANCYAEARNKRFSAGANWGKGKPRRRTSPAAWKHPMKWNQYGVCSSCGDTLFKANRRSMCREYGCDGVYMNPRVFPSLCDWLDEEVPIEWLADFLSIVYSTPNLDWLLLTKRPENFVSRMTKASSCAKPLWAAHLPQGERALPSLRDHWLEWLAGNPPPNVWIGVSVEDQQRADERIPELLRIPACVRFLSVEPLLGPVDLKLVELLQDASEGSPMVHWLIIGGESGPGARPCNVEWIRDLVRQCQSAGVPCFVKQLGAQPIDTINRKCISKDSEPLVTVPWTFNFKHPKGGDPTEWPADLQVRQFPLSHFPTFPLSPLR